MKDVVVIQDLQFGSTGKGLIAGTIACHWGPDTVVTAWGPNAGHTFCWKDEKFVVSMLATSAIMPSVSNILIGPGSVLDMRKLKDEIRHAGNYLKGKNIIIHPQCPLLQEKHAETERKTLMRIGSTMKGTAEAMIDKIRRDPTAVAGSMKNAIYDGFSDVMAMYGMRIIVSSALYDGAIDKSEAMIVEGAQGFSLGVHTDFYPYCTSRDISTAQLFADCRLPFPTNKQKVTVVGTMRTFPIRVANRVDPATGQLVGYSGSHYPDQKEIKWSDIGREPELTTVTRLPRRLFTFSQWQIEEAARICRPDAIALMFCDYVGAPRVDESAPLLIPPSVQEYISRVDRVAPVELFGFGPHMNDVYERDLFAAHSPVALRTASRLHFIDRGHEHD